MNKTTPISLITLLLAGCMSTSAPPRSAGLYAFLDPATGRTYNLPVRAIRESTAETRAGALPGVGVRIGAVAHLDVPERTTLVEPSAAALPTTQSETVRITPAARDVAPPLKLKLDTDFASFALRHVSLETTEKLAVAELV